MKFFKKVGYDIVLLVVMTALYYVLTKSSNPILPKGIFPTGIIMAVCVFIFHSVFHFFIERYTKISKGDDSVESGLNAILTSTDEQLDECLKKLESYKYVNSGFDSVITQFIEKVDSFSRKENALKELIALNGDKAKQFLIERNDAAQAFLVANMKKLVKSLIVYDAKSKKNRASDVSEEKSVQEVFTKVNELIDLYDQLLEEVRNMDDIDLDDPGIKYVIENLKELRIGTEEPLDPFDEVLTANLKLPDSKR